MRRRDKPGNVLTTLVFTDIVGSTQVAEELGDRRWRELLARHHRIVREGLREYGGREVDTAGDGVFARFDSPGAAVRFAASTADALRELGIEIRAGVHIGECEMFDGKLSGINVHVAARTMAMADAGEILVTGNVRDLVRGAGFGFADRGAHKLRGIEGEWHLFEVASIGDSHRPPPLAEGEAKERRRQIEPPPLVQRRRVRLAAVVVAAALLVAAGAFALVQAVSGASAAPLTGCELASGIHLHDHAFNQAVYDGLTAASTKWGIGIRDRLTGTEAQWKRGMSELIGQNCGLIVTVGGFVGGLTAAAAKANPKTRFAITDTPGLPGDSNLLSIRFKPGGAAFLAGYVAAGTTKTGKVATFGGIPAPVVTPFMDGFAAGILYYNRTHGAHVRLLGWDPKTREGTFVSQDPSNGNAFSDRTAPARFTAYFIHSGADVIFPVDGPNGEIAACKAAQHEAGTLLIGVDTDQHYSTPECSAQWLTSVLKIYKQMVFLAMRQVVEHQFKGGELDGTLANGGVGIASFYNLAARIPRNVRREIAGVRKGVGNGSIPVDPGSYSGG